jgi:Protein tyrosine phosphatase-like protein, PTPLA.
MYCTVSLKTGCVYIHRYTFFTVLYPVGVTGELLCLYAAQSYVANNKLWSLEMPNKLNVTFSYHYFLLFTMLLYIPRKFHRSVVMQSLLEYAQFLHLLFLLLTFWVLLALIAILTILSTGSSCLTLLCTTLLSFDTDRYW